MRRHREGGGGSRPRGERGALDRAGWGDGVCPHHRVHNTEANSISREPTFPLNPSAFRLPPPLPKRCWEPPRPPGNPALSPRRVWIPSSQVPPAPRPHGPTHLPGIRERPAAQEEERRSEGPPHASPRRGGSHAACNDLQESWSAGQAGLGAGPVGWVYSRALPPRAGAGGLGGLLAPPGCPVRAQGWL